MATSADGRLSGRVAVVTGGASGMGKASVLRFAAEGAGVVAADLNEAAGAALLDGAEALGLAGRVRFVRANVADEPDIENMIAEAVRSFGQLDIVFNNAGIGGAFGPVTDLHVEDWDETFAVLVRGVFLGVKHGARQLLAQGFGGSIINTASVAGLTGGGGPLAYSAAKAAVINLTRAAALELAEHRVRVNAICPGAIDTPLLAQGRPREKVTAQLAGFQPWPDIGRPEDIAGAALFLASDDSQFVTGEAIVVDGGLTAAGPAQRGIARTAPNGWVGMNRGTTGQGPSVRQRGERIV